MGKIAVLIASFVVTEHVLGTERATSPKVAPRSARSRKRSALDTVEATMILIAKRKADEAAKAKEAAREQAFQQFVTASKLV